jgi:hypothetical protein
MEEVTTTTFPYAKCVENPVRLNCIMASRMFLRSMVTREGLHIVFHRLGSVTNKSTPKPVDHYEIMVSDNRYDDVFIEIYSETNQWIPPEGYLFDKSLDMMMMEFLDFDDENREAFNPEDGIDEKFIYTREAPVDPDQSMDTLIEGLDQLPPLERIIFESFGNVNRYLDDFPFGLIRRYIGDKAPWFEDRQDEVLAGIKPREDTGLERWITGRLL